MLSFKQLTYPVFEIWSLDLLVLPWTFLADCMVVALVNVKGLYGWIFNAFLMKLGEVLIIRVCISRGF